MFIEKHLIFIYLSGKHWLGWFCCMLNLQSAVLWSKMSKMTLWLFILSFKTCILAENGQNSRHRWRALFTHTWTHSHMHACTDAKHIVHCTRRRANAPSHTCHCSQSAIFCFLIYLMKLHRFPINNQPEKMQFYEAHNFKALINIHSYKETIKHIKAKLNRDKNNCSKRHAWTFFGRWGQ